jgi:FkbM family methyltransferase
LRFSNQAIRQYIANKDFIDGGAYIGDSAAVFAKYYFPRKVYSFDISKKIFDKYVQTMTQNKIPDDKYEFINMGLFDKKCETLIKDDAHQGTNLYSKGSAVCKLCDLDSFAQTHSLNIGFIKSDLEGVGLDGLKGMVQTIKKDRPVLSLAIYHNPIEFFDMKIYLEKIVENLDYTIHIKQFHPFHDAVVEVALFAYPKELDITID